MQELYHLFFQVYLPLLMYTIPMEKGQNERFTDNLIPHSTKGEGIRPENELTYLLKTGTFTGCGTLDACLKFDRKRQEDLNKMYKDKLTGLYNRNFLEETIENFKIKDELSAFISIDVNGFKETNDLHGHRVGDLLLKKVSNVLIQSFRKDDLIFRMGGDEFGILLENLNFENKSDDDIEKFFIERIRTNCQKVNQEIEKEQHSPFSINVAIGFSFIDPKTDTSLTEVIDRSDVLMYEDKEKSKSFKKS
ncbi:MAG: GGDEF domain-containing protein [Candidatus Shapirobacteria bacterium]|nr:GGDEF domain-containing protein [Candidatus Shapirobacteria bacterium]